MTKQYTCRACGDIRYTWAGYKQHTRLAHNLRLRVVTATSPEATPKDIRVARNANLSIVEPKKVKSRIIQPEYPRLARIVQ